VAVAVFAVFDAFVLKKHWVRPTIFCAAMTVFAAAALLIRNIIKLLSDDKGRHKLPSYQYSTELIFGGEVFETIKTAENFTVHKTYPYGTINKAVETANYFFIFENPKKAFIINKSELTEGSVPELEQFLSARFGKRFVDKRSVKI
jgi:hypothetical protein